MVSGCTHDMSVVLSYPVGQVCLKPGWSKCACCTRACGNSDCGVPYCMYPTRNKLLPTPARAAAVSSRCSTASIYVSFVLSITTRFSFPPSHGIRLQGEFQGIHFHQGHYEAMGHSLCEVLLHLVDPDQTKVEGIVRKLKDK